MSASGIPAKRREHVGPLGGEPIDVAAAAAPGAAMQGLGPHHPPFAMQPLQADLAGASRGGLKGQGVDLRRGQQSMGVEQAQDLKLPGPDADPHHEFGNRLERTRDLPGLGPWRRLGTPEAAGRALDPRTEGIDNTADR